MTTTQSEKKISEFLQKNQKSIDEIQQHVWDIITINRLTNSEVAALLTSFMRTTLLQPHNQELLKKIGLSKENLTPRVVVETQNILTIQWLQGNPQDK